MNTITRRGSLKRLGALAAGTFVVPMINRGRFELFAQSTEKYSARAIDLLRQSTVLPRWIEAIEREQALRGNL